MDGGVEGRLGRERVRRGLREVTWPRRRSVGERGGEGRDRKWWWSEGGGARDGGLRGKGGTSDKRREGAALSFADRVGRGV